MRDTKTELTETEVNQVGIPTSGGGSLSYTEVVPAWLPWGPLGWVRNH